MTVYAVKLVRRLELLRKKAQLSKTDIAVLLGVSRKSYHNWMNGDHIPNNTHEPAMQALIDKIEDALHKGILPGDKKEFMKK